MAWVVGLADFGFFFSSRRRHTRLQGDWSSDVCSSDLERLGSLSAARAAALGAGLILLLPYGIGTVAGADFPPAYAARSPTQKLVGYEIGRASGRERV